MNQKQILGILFFFLNGIAFSDPDFSLKHSVQIAIKNNPDILISQIQNSLPFFEEREAKFKYFPVWKTSISNIKTRYLSVYQTETSGENFRITDKYLSFVTQLDQSLPTGGSIFSKFETNRSDTSSSDVLLSPFYFSTLTFGFSQPLLKGYDWFGTHLGDSWANLRVASKKKNRSLWDFKGSLSETILNIELGYRKLVEQWKKLEAQKKAIETLEKELDIMERKTKAGLTVPADSYNTQERLQSQKRSKLLAEQDYLQAKANFVNLLGGMEGENWEGEKMSQGWNHPIPSYSLSRSDLLKMVFQNNFSIKSAQMKVDEKKSEMLQKKNLLFPTLNFSGSFFLNGGNTPNSPGFGDNLDDLLDTSTRGWEISLNMEIPFGPSPDAQNYRKSCLEYQQALYEKQKQINLILSEVLPVWEKVNAGFLLIETAKKTVELAEKKIHFEQRRFESGLATNFNLLQYQQDLTEALVKEVENTVNYLNSVSQLDFYTGKTLEKYGIQVLEEKNQWKTKVLSE